MSTNRSTDVRDGLQSLKRRFKNMVVLDVDRSPRYVLAQAVGYAIAGKRPVIVGPASLLMDGASILKNNIAASGLDVKVVIVDGEVNEPLAVAVHRASDSDAPTSFLAAMMERFGPEVCVL